MSREYAVLLLHLDMTRQWHGPYQTRAEAQARGDQPDVVRVLELVEEEN
jgi:hypothetical protein